MIIFIYILMTICGGIAILTTTLGLIAEDFSPKQFRMFDTAWKFLGIGTMLTLILFILIFQA